MRPADETGANDEPVQAPTVCAAFQRLAARHPDKLALRTLGRERTWTWAELNGEVREVAAGLAAAGIGHGDTVAMMLPNVPECHLVDLAAVHLGAVPFAIYNSSSVEQVRYQLEDAATTIIITQQSYLEKVLAAGADLDALRTVVVVDGPAPEGVTAFADLVQAGEPGFDFESAWRTVGEEDLVTLIYTSGTTGPPKGALWAHRSVMTQLRALGAAMPLASESIVSFLPMAHAGGRIAAHYMALPHGATITCCPDLNDLPHALADARPDAMFTVPRVWEKLRAGIEAMLAAADEETRAEGRAIIASGEARARAGEAPEPPAPLLLPILRRLGLDRLRVAFIGGAPSAPALSEFFRGCGVPLLEAYGSTECGLNVFNRIDDFRGGTVGKPLPGVELRIAADGEILVRARLNMVGYRNRPEQSAETLDADGWLHTGDIGEVDADGFLSVVDRKKDIIISAAGKNMSPVNIEAAIKPESALIGQMATIGDGRRFITALVVLDPDGAAAFATQHGLETTDIAALARHPEVLAEVDAAVKRGNERLSRVEQVKKHMVLATSWLPDSEEMTPTMKLKRRAIAAKYRDEIEQLYAD
ncbi:MAG: long-chain fatty acid--CoA ligase [Solirubrobacterales bacterium]|nr:long-chain fatty acid--CoA ligase [Solirubrobacterales bacterium]